MSTRCQVRVIQRAIDIFNKPWEEDVTLYHHTDGYPEYMIPIIWNAYNFTDEEESIFESNKASFRSWQKERAGKVASFLCWADPGVFEPEAGHELHVDIEYYYRIYCTNPDGKQMQTDLPPYWEIEILVPDGDFWDDPVESNLKIHTKRTRLDKLIKKYRP